MKKVLYFAMAAVMTIAVGSISFGETKAKASKTNVQKNEPAKKAPASKPVVIAKGVQIQICSDLKDNGTITVPGMSGISIPVKKGKFDLSLPASPVLSADIGELQSSEEMDFGDAKVYSIHLNFQNSKRGEGHPSGDVYTSFKLIYSDRDVNGTFQGESVALKKGWNVIGEKKNPTASGPCAG